MPVDIIVPPLSQTSDTLLLQEWLKKPGDTVQKGEALFTVETDKASLEVEAPESGVLYEIYAQPQSEIAVHSVIGKILREGEQLPQQEAIKGEEPPPEPKPTSAMEIQKTITEAPKKTDRLFSSPRARKLAQEKGVDLTKATPSGPRGMVVERDVRQLMEKNQAEVAPMSHTRQVIAKWMMESHLGSAPVSYLREVDVTNLVKLHGHVLDKLPKDAVRPTFTDFFIWILCLALQQHPRLNATVINGHPDFHPHVNLTLAVDTERGLIVPVIHNAEQLTLSQIAEKRQELVTRAIAGNSLPDELIGGTFTLTDLGALGIDFFTPIIKPPQVAILGIGRIREVPAFRDGGIYVCSTVVLALTCDHRFIDGAPAAKFLDTVNQLIEKAEQGVI